MFYRGFICITVLISFLIFIGCGGSKEDEQIESLEKAQEQLSQVSEQFAEGMKGMTEAMQGKSGVEPVHFSKLKDLLPEEANGFTRSSAEGHSTKAMGINVSEAKAKYKSDSGSRLNVHITDLGSMSGLTAMATAAWAFSDFEKESDKGYEKTTSIAGYKAMEKYNKINNDGELSIMVAGRFIFEVNGYDVEMDQIKGFVDKIDLDALKDLIKE